MKFLILILFLATIINICLAIYSLVFRKNSLSYIFAAYSIAIGFYTLGYALELSSSTLLEIKSWLKVEYMGISFLPTIWMLLVLQYVGKENILRKRYLVAMYGFSFITLLLHFTNDYHHLFYKAVSLDTTSEHVLVSLTKGVWYWFHQAYANLTTLVGSILLIQMFFSASKAYRKQTSIMLLSSFVPWVFYLVYITGHSPHNIDLIAIGLTISCVIYAIGLFRYSLFEFVPLALENVFENMEDAVIIIDRNNNVANFNKSAIQLFPILNRPNNSRSIKAILSEYTQLYNLSATKIKQVIDIEVEIDNEIKYYHTRITTISGGNKKAIGQIIILTDITEKKKALDKLIENESRLKELVATKDKFFSIIAHDLMNPFNALFGYGQLLKNSLEEKSYSEAINYTEIINNSSKQVYSLLQNLLIWSRAQTGNMRFIAENVNINHLITEVYGLLNSVAHSKKISVSIDAPEDIEVPADFNMLNAVLRNLVSNAIKFTDRNGSIRIKAYTENDYIIVCVSDTGVGIEKENLKNIFSIGQSVSSKGTENETGTGLGLIICKEFIEMHRGKVWVESTPGKGSSFYFSIPTSSIN